MNEPLTAREAPTSYQVVLDSLRELERQIGAALFEIPLPIQY